MSDFSNYIRVAIQGLSENTPLARASAYERVRKGIKRQLESRAADEAEIAETLEELENAILDMEAEQLMHPTLAAETATPAKPQEPASAFRSDSNVTPIGRRAAEAPAREPANPKITETAPSGQDADSRSEAPRVADKPAEAAPPPISASATPSYSPQRAGASTGTATQALKVEASDRDLLEEFQSALTAELALPISPEEAQSRPEPEAPVREEPAAVAPPAMKEPASAPVSEPGEVADDSGFDVKILLRKAVDSEDMRDPATREIIYRRARNALVKYLKSLSPQPDFDAVHAHIEKLNAAIREVEADLARKSASIDNVDPEPIADGLASELADIWSADFEQAAYEEPERPRQPKQSRPKPDDLQRTIADEVEEAVQELAAADFAPEMPERAPEPEPQPSRSIDDEVEEAVQELIAADSGRRQTPKREAPKGEATKKPERRKVRPAPVEDFEEEIPAPSNDRGQGRTAEQIDRWGVDDDSFELPEDMFDDDFAMEEPAAPVAANQSYAAERKPRRRGGLGRILAILLVLLIGGGVAAAVAFPDATARYTEKAKTTGTWLFEFVAGLAGEPASPTPGERETDTAAATDMQESEPAAEQAEPMADTETANANMTPASEESVEKPAEEPAIAPINGEKAFLFATSGGQPLVTGNVAWSVIESAPQPGMPPEPAIRGEVAIPDDGLRATLTLRRNSDKTLPATHLFELVFAPADGIASSEVASVEGITFVQSGQDRSQPLIGSVVKIADNIFLFALADVPQARQLHQSLFTDPDLIEIQFVYYSGRRTTLRLVTGETGGRVFETAMDAWAAEEGATATATAPEPVQPEPVAAPEAAAPEAPTGAGADTTEPEGQPAEETATSEAEPGRPVIPDNVPIPLDRPLFDG